MTIPPISEYFINNPPAGSDESPDTDAYKQAEALVNFRIALLEYYDMSDLPATEANLEIIQAIEDEAATHQMNDTELTELFDEVKAAFPMEAADATAPTLEGLVSFIINYVDTTPLLQLLPELRVLIQQELAAFKEAHPSYTEESIETLINDIKEEYTFTSETTTDELNALISAWEEAQLLDFPPTLQALMGETSLAEFKEAHQGYTEAIGAFGLNLLTAYEIQIPSSDADEFATFSDAVKAIMVKLSDAEPPINLTTLMDATQAQLNPTDTPAPTIEDLQAVITNWIDDQAQLQALMGETLAEFQGVHPGYTAEIGAFGLNLLANYQMQIPSSDADEFATFSDAVKAIMVKLSDAQTPMKLTTLETLMTDIQTEYTDSATIEDLEAFITNWIDTQPQFLPALQQLMREPLANFTEAHPKYTEAIGTFGLDLIDYYHIEIPSSIDYPQAFAIFSTSFQNIIKLLSDSKVTMDLDKLMTDINTQYSYTPAAATNPTWPQITAAIELAAAIANTDIEYATASEKARLQELGFLLTPENLYIIRNE